MGDAGGDGSGEAGNMFVPIDLLAPILGDLIADGRAARDPRPWIGVTTNEVYGRLVVSQVTPQSPAEKAGLRRGDIITGIGGTPTKTLPELLSENLVAGKCRRDRAARFRARRRQPPRRRHLDEPARSSEAEKHVLSKKIAALTGGDFFVFVIDYCAEEPVVTFGISIFSVAVSFPPILPVANSRPPPTTITISAPTRTPSTQTHRAAEIVPME